MRIPKLLSRHSEFLGHVVTLMSGKMIAAAIALLTTPIVARLFDPADFGVAAVFVSIISIVSNVSSLRYESTLSLPKQEEEARMLMSLCYGILFAICIAMATIVAILKTSGVRLATLEVLGVWAWVLPIGLFLLGALKVQECWLTRQKHFKLSSVSLVMGNTVTSGSRIAFGAAAGTSVYGLVTGYLLGISTRLLIQRSASREALRVSFRRLDWAAMRKVVREYSDFPMFNAPAGFLFSLGGNLPVLLFGTMFSPAIAGFYAMANRLAQVPTTIVANSMRRVFLQKAASIRNRGDNLRKAYLLATAGLALIGIAPLIIVTLYGQPMLGWLLGERWLQAGRYLEIIAPWMFMIWVTAPANPVFVVLRHQKFWLWIQSTITVLRLAAFGIAYLAAADIEWTLRAFVNVTVACNLIAISIALWMIRRHAASIADDSIDDDKYRQHENWSEPD